MTESWTREEWERRKASLFEDTRILQAELNEQYANAQMLRERGHPEPALALEAAIMEAEALIKQMRDTFDAIDEEETPE